jgi:hypothetical protein
MEGNKMLDSDAPKPISDNVYIPQDRQRKVIESEEASDDGGSYSFIFYDRNAKQKNGEHPKKEPVDIGDPVKLTLSQESAQQTSEATDSQDEKELKKDKAPPSKENEKDKDESQPTGGSINITV